VELAALVALGLATGVLCLSGAELAEVFSRLWDDVLVQLHLDPAQLLPCRLMSVAMGTSREGGVR
jgi:hypothetical protein